MKKRSCPTLSVCRSAQLPKALVEKYAYYCEVLGPRGPVQPQDLIIGLFLFAPATTYPQHTHTEIEESSISVAESWSESNAAVFLPNIFIGRQ